MNGNQHREMAIANIRRLGFLVTQGNNFRSGETNMELKPNDQWQTQARGTNSSEYQLYLDFADDGEGGDITRNGEPLLSYDEWLGA